MSKTRSGLDYSVIKKLPYSELLTWFNDNDYGGLYVFTMKIPDVKFILDRVFTSHGLGTGNCTINHVWTKDQNHQDCSIEWVYYKLFGTYYTLEEEESYEENYTLGCHRFLEMYKNIESNYYNVHFTETVETSHDFNDDSDK